MEILIMMITVKAIFHENDKYYSYILLDECLHKL